MNIFRSTALLFCFISGGILWGASSKPGGQGNPENDQTIRVNVEMVSLPVVVTTRTGERVTDLKRDDFQVYEDGVKQQIAGFASTDEPVDVALLLDTSGSTEDKLARIQNAAIDFVHQLHPDDEVAILSFANDTNLLEDFSIDRDRNEYGIKETRPGGCTVEYEAVWLALEEVLKPIKERKALVIFTDGVDTCSHKASEKETIELAKETRATIYCVYYNTEDDLYRNRRSYPGSYPGQVPPIIISPLPPIIGVPGTIPGTRRLPGPGSRPEDYMRGRAYLNKLAEYSGGMVFDGMEDLNGAFANVAKELASQYSIGYYSTNPKHDGKFRKVEVKVDRPGLVARTKRGYYARKEKKR